MKHGMKKKSMANGGAMMKKKGYTKGGMPMTTVNGMKVPKFAADGKGPNDMKKKAYAKGGKVMTYNLGGMVKSVVTINTGIKKAKGGPIGGKK